MEREIKAKGTLPPQSEGAKKEREFMFGLADFRGLSLSHSFYLSLYLSISLIHLLLSLFHLSHPFSLHLLFSILTFPSVSPSLSPLPLQASRNVLSQLETSTELLAASRSMTETTSLSKRKKRLSKAESQWFCRCRYVSGVRMDVSVRM